jgi:hypothetical protein
MNYDDKKRHFLLWDKENELPLITVLNKHNRTAYGLFFFTSNPSEVIIIPSENRLLLRTYGDGIFSLYVYNGPSLRDV